MVHIYTIGPFPVRPLCQHGLPTPEHGKPLDVRTLTCKCSQPCPNTLNIPESQAPLHSFQLNKKITGLPGRVVGISRIRKNIHLNTRSKSGLNHLNLTCVLTQADKGGSVSTEATSPLPGQRTYRSLCLDLGGLPREMALTRTPLPCSSILLTVTWKMPSGPPGEGHTA